MQIRHSVGMNVAHINPKCGVKLIILTCLLLAFTGCQRHVLIDLLNESGDTIQVVDYSAGHPVEKTVNNHDRLSVLSPVPLVIREHKQQQNYFIGSVPKEFIQSEFRGRLISVELGNDEKLYLLMANKKSPTERDIPQPNPFPIMPTK